jgi:hypothetical protein
MTVGPMGIVRVDYHPALLLRGFHIRGIDELDRRSAAWTQGRPHLPLSSLARYLCVVSVFILDRRRYRFRSRDLCFVLFLSTGSSWRIKMDDRDEQD